MASGNASEPWQILPFYRSLSEQVLLLGVPKPVIVLNCLIAYLFIFDLHFFYIIPVNIAIHFGAVYLAKNDDQFFDCIKSYISKKKFYNT